MLVSLRFWAFCVAVGIILHFIFGLGWMLIPRLIVYYVITMYFKKSKFFFKQVPEDVKPPKKSYTILITGASTGIGAEAARQMANKGANVIGASRTLEPIGNTLKSTYKAMYLNLADLESIENFVRDFKSRESRLDCLILNAAYYGPRAVTTQGFEQNIGVNHLGHMYLTYLLFDLLVQSAPSRIIVVSSDCHRVVSRVKFDDLQSEKGSIDHQLGGFLAYAHSKVCNLLFMKKLAQILKGSGVTVHACHPGTPVQSQLMRNNFLGSFVVDRLILAPAYHLFCRQASDGAQNLIHCAISEYCGKSTGHYFENLDLSEPSKVARSQYNAEKLWRISCDLLKIENRWNWQKFLK